MEPTSDSLAVKYSSSWTQNSNLVCLAAFTAREGLFKEKPEIIKVNIGKSKFTILNHTDQNISIDPSLTLTVNGCPINRFRRHSHIIAYHLENHPELICFEQKLVSSSEPGPRFYTRLSWGHMNRIPLDLRTQPNYSAFTFNPDGLNLCLPSPLLKASFQIREIFPFPAHDYLNSQFKKLFKEVAQEAILQNIPKLLVHHAANEKIQMTLLNFTKHKISLEDDGYIWIKDQRVIGFTEGFFGIAYHVKGHPKYVCIDYQSDLSIKENPEDRIILKKGFKLWNFFFANSFKKANREKFGSLFSIQPQEINNVQDILNHDNNLREILFSLPKIVDFHKHPVAKIYQSRFNLTSTIGRVRYPDTTKKNFKVLNYTPYNISFDVNGRLRVENQAVAHFKGENCDLIAYQCRNISNKIFFSYKYHKENFYIQSLTILPSWEKAIFHLANSIFKKINIERAFKILWAASFDENSLFYRSGDRPFPSEIMAIIAKYYII